MAMENTNDMGRLTLDQIISIQYGAKNESPFSHWLCAKPFKYNTLWRIHCCTNCSEYVTDEELFEITTLGKLYSTFSINTLRMFKKLGIWQELVNKSH